MKNKSARIQAILYSLIFAVLFLAAYIPFFSEGRTFVTKPDGIDQYYMGFMYFGRYLREFIKGLLSGSPSLPLYDLSIGMGEDIFGSLNYYGFADPVWLMSVFARGSAAPYIYSAGFFLRLFLAGIAFLVYCRQMKLGDICALAGVFCFIINGFTYGGVSSYMGWGSVLIYLPLMLTAVEREFAGERGARLLMLLASVYAALCGFYFLYMCCVFLVVYCIGRGICIFGFKGISVIIRKSMMAAVFLVLGILLAGPVFFPSVSGFLGSERAKISIASIIFDKKNWTPYWPVYLSFINRSARYYFKYVSKATIAEYIAVIWAFFLPRGKGKTLLCIANTVIMLTVALPITGYIFSGFGESGFEVNTRWAFLIHFIFSVNLVYVLDHISKAGIRGKKGGPVYAVFAIAFVLVLLGTGSVVFKSASSKGNRISAADVSRNFDSPVLHSSVIAEDDDVYRISLDRFMTNTDRPENSAMVHGYYGITYWLSIMNGYTQYASDELCGRQQEWRSDGFSHEGVYETAMGVKYYLNKTGEGIPKGYRERESFDYYGEKWTLYENTAWYGLARARDAADFDRRWKDKTSYKEYFGYVTESAGQERSGQSREEGSGQGGSVQESTGQSAYGSGIRELTYDNRRGVMRILTDDTAGDELVVSIPYSNGWKVTVDGRETPTYVKDLMCLCAATGGGTHVIELTYRSRPFEAGCIAALLTILFLIITAIKASPPRGGRQI